MKRNSHLMELEATSAIPSMIIPQKFKLRSHHIIFQKTRQIHEGVDANGDIEPEI